MNTLIPKLFVGTPTHVIKRYAAKAYTHGLVKSTLVACPVSIVCNSKEKMRDEYKPFEVLHLFLGADYYGNPQAIHRRILISMHYVREQFLHSGAEWLLSLEADLILTPEILEQMEHRVNTVPDLRVLYTNCYRGFIQDIKGLGLTNRITLGCTLLHREVVDRFPFRIEWDNLKAFHDAHLANDCSNAGIPMHYDNDIIVNHVESIGTGRGWGHLPITERYM